MKKEIIRLENTKKSTLPVITKSLISQADDLAKEHEQFNANYIVGGRLALYDLLAKIFTLYQQLDAAPDKKDLISDMKHKLVHSYKIRVQSNSSDTAVLVRYITRADRKTAHVYARAIESAVSNQISVEQFTDYVQECGGVENIRSLGVDPATKAKQEESEQFKYDLGWKYCLSREELPFAVFESPTDFSKRKDVSFEYYACIKRKGMRYVIANIPADPAFHDRAIQLIGNQLGALENAEELVSKLHDKAMEARKERWDSMTPGMAKILEGREQKEKGEV
ncbi:hypothetical protein ICU98_06840 [Polynucleobacter sp. MWH-P3-07-1]|uniref:hypothetical protein n=1 Tax=Polynucleobacter sp. MWH-P3-07-1 TaxID=1743173 RepID=UPI001BFDBCED|nr:hypothetical protein [Polynucleobacter sp. MWH-P3-07-1]QWD83145.1 hypothetical protein ICU98_06840 [Polynucleobacter sp. MWH-P3-07-1]